MIRKHSIATCLLLMAATSARAQVTAPSVYTSSIQVQGEAAGTEFADWAASGISIVDMDPADNTGGSPPFIDIADVQIANDDQFVYIHATMHAGPTSFANLFLAFDSDQNVATGFDVFGLGLIGSELGYQTDFPFGQATGVFNTGATITGGPLGNGGALIYPFWTEAGAPQGTEMEWAVSRNVLINGSPAFPTDSFDVAIYATNGLGDISQRISYTFADPPAGPDGDYNDDGNVDAADYAIWRKYENTTNPLPNDPHGGTIDSDQYETWTEHFGEPPGGSGAGFGAVPEPTTAYLLIAGAMACGLLLRRRN
jgi:hypothetical protein